MVDMAEREIGPVGTGVRVAAGVVSLVAAVLLLSGGVAGLPGLVAAGLLGFLGVSFLLAATVGLSGCEVAAVPSLATRRRRHLFCVGGLSHLDRWEAARRKG